MKNHYDNIPDCHYRVSAKAIMKNDAWKFMLCLDDSWYWDFPGWGIDHGEDIHQALEREIMEEMWIKLTWFSPQPVYSYLTESTKEGLPICILFYYGELEHYDFISSDECREIWFFDSEQAENLKTYVQNQEIIKYLEKI